MTHSNENQNRSKALYACVFSNFLVILVIFTWMAFTRNIDGDEGLYLEAARLVGEGKVLYRDFFFQQMPLIPYLYAGWMKLFGFSLMSSRWLSVLLTASAGLVMLIYVARQSQSRALISLYALLFYGSGIVLAWAPVFKTHPINFFCLTVSAISLVEWRNGSRIKRWLLFISGLAIGIGMNSRLMFIPFAFVLAFFIVFQNRRWLRDLSIFVLALGITSIPTFYFFYSNPSRFIQYNLLYHLQIYPGLVNTHRRLITAQNVFLREQMILFLTSAALGLLIAGRKKWRDFFNTDTAVFGSLLICFIIIHMNSAEPYTQYFSAMVPWAMLAALPFFQSLAKWPRWAMVPVLVGFSLIFLSSMKPTLNFEVASMGSDNPLWELGNFRKSVAVAKKVIPPNQECLTWWPGYAFEAGCQSVPGMENHMRNHAIDVGVTGETLEQYQMMSEERLIEDLGEKKFPYIIEGVYRIRGPYADYIDYVMEENYHSVAQIKGVTIWASNDLSSHYVKGPLIQGVRGKVIR